MSPIKAVFHLLTIFVNVVDPEAIRICLTLLWNRCRLSSSTLKKHWAVLSFVISFCKFHTPSLWVNSSCVVLHFGKILHSNPLILNNKLGLSLLYTLTKLFSHCIVVVDRGNRFLMSQNTARPLKMTNLNDPRFQFNQQFSTVREMARKNLTIVVYLQINVMFHKTHSRIARPTFFIIITHDIFIIRIWMLCQISLN